MKTILSLLYAFSFLLTMACNNETSDSVDKAEAVNEDRKQKADSTGAYQADNESANFLVNAANGQMAEAQLGEVARQKGTHQKIKEIGGMMMKEHAAYINEVRKLATERNVSLPMVISDEMQKQVEGVGGKKGEDFDKAYIGQMIRDHQQMVSLFRKAIEKVNDPDVRTFASNTLPKLEEQLESFLLVQKMIR